MLETIAEQRGNGEQDIYEENSTDSEGVIYSYDDLNRLVCIEYSDGTVVQYEYDVTGNILNIQAKTKNSEEIESSEKTVDSYVSEGESLQNQHTDFSVELSEIEGTEEENIISNADTMECISNVDDLTTGRGNAFGSSWCLVVSIVLIFIIIMITVCGKRGKVKNENAEE